MKRKIVIILCCFLLLFSSFSYENKTKCIFADSSDCKSSLLVDYESGKILYENNIDEKLPIASIVKLMTLYLTFEALDNMSICENDYMQVSEYASSMGGSQLFLDSNTSHKVCDLIKSIVIASANDSAVVLAENISGSEENFVKLMNNKAKELNMTNTLYVDSTGLNENGYSTARDISIISRLVLNNERYKAYSKIWIDSYTHPSSRVTELVNTNKLIRQYENCIAGKTGTTEKAGYCFTSLSDNNGFKLVSVILGAKDSNLRFNLAKELFLTGYANYKYEIIYKKDDFFKSIKFNKANNEKVNLYLKEDVGILLHKNEKLKYDIKFKQLIFNAPIKKDTVVATIEISNDNYIKEIELYIKDNVEKSNILDNVVKIIKKW